MPSVDGKEFPYTPKGMAAAAKAKRMKPSKEDASGRMAQRGLSKAAGTKGRQMPRRPKAVTPREKETLEKMVPLKRTKPKRALPQLREGAATIAGPKKVKKVQKRRIG